ncbi:tyrosine-type recombinase/integrase [Hespellia stercorisuis]|uniref:Site-specific recombinase XerD n=1 Tax=Hespellia stercorisuis DSM 15480 TaxID=1121950 RepID=A0A1M6I9X7_9FIRM|nr:tyrosine-type recombinase/integrase [Hespellia stercorisuis]SHJ31232.1 Site-specific recombinase XerD [Hespellia stercorisuis DSM 15480]
MPAYRLQPKERKEALLQDQKELRKQLGREIDSCMEIKSTHRNKAKKILADMEVWHIADIDYEVRSAYEDYLTRETSMQAVTVRAYVRGLDQMKRHALREQMQTLKGKRDALENLDKQILFLPYHPEQEIASQFERFVYPESLVWDFRQDASGILKIQIFDVLHALLRSGMNTSIRNGKLEALKTLYAFCIREQVRDLEGLEQKHIARFQAGIAQKQKQATAMQVLDQSRKILFMGSKEINWNANVWYLERFHFEKTRTNPTNPVRTFSFLEVAHRQNKRYLQQYMKYCLGVTHLAVSVIQIELILVRNFIVWLEQKEVHNVCCVAEATIERYFKKQEQLDIKEAAFNRKVTSILHFFDYLKVRGFITKIPLCAQYYRKKEILKHHDRCVGVDVYTELLGKLQFFPENLRLMFLHLWGIGLRASEVCSLKGNAYSIQGRDAWIQVYQIKMQNYKRIPIPWALYRLMKVYLEKYQIGPEAYVFQNRKGGAYCYTTFRKNMLKCCEERQIADGGYLFKSHDYRHTVATMYYDNDASIQSVRDYLGHDHEEMTRQYVDYMPKKIAKASEEYFSKKNNSLAVGIKRCKRGT